MAYGCPPRRVGNRSAQKNANVLKKPHGPGASVYDFDAMKRTVEVVWRMCIHSLPHVIAVQSSLECACVINSYCPLHNL